MPIEFKKSFTVRESNPPPPADGRRVDVHFDGEAPDRVAHAQVSFEANDLIRAMGAQVQNGDEVEVIVRVLTRVVIKRETL